MPQVPPYENASRTGVRILLILPPTVLIFHHHSLSRTNCTVFCISLKTAKEIIHILAEPLATVSKQSVSPHAVLPVDSSVCKGSILEQFYRMFWEAH